MPSSTHQVLLKMGLHPTTAQVDEAMKSIDQSKDGVIQFDEFVLFYKNLEERTGGFSSVFQQYMSQFKTTESVQESVKQFLAFLNLNNAKVRDY